MLSVHQLSKRFARVQALREVSLRWEAGKVYGLAGENGAGKSTLIKIVSGVHAPDSGDMQWQDARFAPRSARAAEAAGIQVFHQEIPICPNLSVAANVFLGPRQPGHTIFPQWAKLEEKCMLLYRELLGIEMDVRRVMRDCTAAERQLALLVRVLSRRARLIILDEPTTALTSPEVDRLFEVIRRLRDQGVTFVFVSHLLDELVELCDEIHVLRDGARVGHLHRTEFDRSTLANLIAGRCLEERRSKSAVTGNGVKLEVKGLARAGEFADVSFKVSAGEILGITGLQGSGRSAVARALFAAPAATSGEVFLEGRQLHLQESRDAIRARIGYVPEDRKSLGLFRQLDVQTNLGVTRVASLSKWGWLSRHRLRQLAESMRERLHIKMPSQDAPVTSLSGGNQQKVLLARWFAIDPQVLVMNEPTRGVDVGAKDEICQLLRSMAEGGVAFVLASSDLDEVLALADRILVMRRGRITAEFTRAQATKAALIHAAASELTKSNV